MVKENTFSNLAGLREISIAPGAIFLGPWADIDHETFLIVAMIEDVLRQRQPESTSDVDTDKGVSQIFTQDMSVEELYSVISDEIDTIYAK
jgi:hypothetical protein